LRQALELYDFHQAKIAECDVVIEAVLQRLNQDRETPEKPLPDVQHAKGRNEPRFDPRPALYTLLGADLTQIHGFGPYTVLRLVAECGDDMSKWPSAKHFTSWLCLAPGNKISGGRLLSSKTRRSSSRVAALLRIAAVNSGRTQTALGAFYRRLAARTGKAKAVTATAIAAIFAETRGRYGSPRVRAELRVRGQQTGRHRVARLMRSAGLRARERRRFRCTTDSNHGMAITGNLLARRFAVLVPDTGWVTDITYLWTLEGWLYLAVILDLFSPRVVGWALHERLERKLALEALHIALAQRQPAQGLLHHSDSRQSVCQR
jgi:hypothetical protein